MPFYKRYPLKEGALVTHELNKKPDHEHRQQCSYSTYASNFIYLLKSHNLREPHKKIGGQIVQTLRGAALALGLAAFGRGEFGLALAAALAAFGRGEFDLALAAFRLALVAPGRVTLERARTLRRPVDLPRVRTPRRLADLPRARRPRRLADLPRARRPRRLADLPRARRPRRLADLPRARTPRRLVDLPRARTPRRPVDLLRARTPRRSVDLPRAPALTPRELLRAPVLDLVRAAAGGVACVLGCIRKIKSINQCRIRKFQL